MLSLNNKYTPLFLVTEYISGKGRNLEFCISNEYNLEDRQVSLFPV